MTSRILDLVKNDIWSRAEGRGPNGPALWRFRTPVLQPVDITSHQHVLRVVWIYDDAESGELPTGGEMDRLATFENLMCDALEKDYLAALTAVFTADGARQWVWYTDHVALCGIRINRMPQEKERYPIELDTFEDPDWSYLRERILGSVNYQASDEC